MVGTTDFRSNGGPVAGSRLGWSSLLCCFVRRDKKLCATFLYLSLSGYRRNTARGNPTID